MRQLTGVDSGFLYMENSRTIGHVAGVMILDPSTAPRPVNADTVREFLAARIHLLAPLRWRLVTVPLGIDRSYWIDDPDLDLEFHVRGIALPAPGNAHQLAEQVARLASRPLDRSHPLWELYVIEGLEGGRVAEDCGPGFTRRIATRPITRASRIPGPSTPPGCAGGPTT